MFPVYIWIFRFEARGASETVIVFHLLLLIWGYRYLSCSFCCLRMLFGGLGFGVWGLDGVVGGLSGIELEAWVGYGRKMKVSGW
jgi:hypothetical protein